MATINRHPAGNFAWIELATTDQADAKRFYSTLFGWETRDFPMGPDASYTMFGMGERQTGGAYKLTPQEAEASIPPHWQIYIGVDDAGATAQRAGELGAKVVHGAFEVGSFGRMAVLQDPTGAYFSVWQAGEHHGMGVAGEPGAFCWADLQTRERQRAVEFYGGLFGWEFLPGKDKDPNGYLHIRNGEQYIGGAPPAESLPAAVPPHWLVYIQCADCTGQTARAEELGAKVLLAPTTIEGQLQFSVVADPQGAALALFEPKHG